MLNKPRKLWMAGILSIIQPGLGHVYNGEIRKSLIIYLLPFLLLPLLIFGLYTRFAIYYLALFTLLIIVYYVLVIFDAVRIAKIFSTIYPLKKYNNIIIYIGILILAVSIRVSVQGFIKNSIIRTYKLSAVSMEPTLLAGDYILVDLREGAKNPKKKDLVIFEYPKDPSKDFVKRVVAVSGDTVEIKDKQLIVNGNIIKEEYVVYTDVTTYPTITYPRDQFGPVTVPANSYFVMGDNRDHSLDSRFFGFVSKNMIKGTLKSIYWSYDRKTSSIRWNRIGKKIS